MKVYKSPILKYFESYLKTQGLTLVKYRKLDPVAKVEIHAKHLQELLKLAQNPTPPTDEKETT